MTPLSDLELLTVWEAATGHASLRARRSSPRALGDDAPNRCRSARATARCSDIGTLVRLAFRDRAAAPNAATAELTFETPPVRPREPRCGGLRPARGPRYRLPTPAISWPLPIVLPWPGAHAVGRALRRWGGRAFPEIIDAIAVAMSEPIRMAICAVATLSDWGHAWDRSSSGIALLSEVEAAARSRPARGRCSRRCLRLERARDPLAAAGAVALSRYGDFVATISPRSPLASSACGDRCTAGSVAVRGPRRGARYHRRLPARQSWREVHVGSLLSTGTSPPYLGERAAEVETIMQRVTRPPSRTRWSPAAPPSHPLRCACSQSGAQSGTGTGR